MTRADWSNPPWTSWGLEQPYQRGTWGPVEADQLLQGGHWHAPAGGVS